MVSKKMEEILRSRRALRFFCFFLDFFANFAILAVEILDSSLIIIYNLYSVKINLLCHPERAKGLKENGRDSSVAKSTPSE